MPHSAGPAARRAQAALPVGDAAVSDLARRIAADAPELKDLSEDELAAVARAVLAGRLTEELKTRVDLARIDYADERAAFLAASSSDHTRRAYGRALDELEAFAARRGRDVLELRPRDADAFIRSHEGAPASVRLTAAAVSSFYTFLERETEGRVHNPVRGTRARPRSSRVRSLEVPSAEAVAALLARLVGNSELRGAVAVMAFRGLRVGALPDLAIKGSRFRTVSKGKAVDGELPEAALGILKEEGLPLRAPFAGLSAQRIADRFRYWTEKLCREGILEAAYSVHDLRHFFSVTEYRTDHDLYRVSKLLGHSGIAVTEAYLRSLGET